MISTVVVLVIAASLATFIYVGVRSRHAKRQLTFSYEPSEPDGLPALKSRLVDARTFGWHLFGEGGMRDSVVRQTIPDPSAEANFLSMVRGGPFRSVYAVGVNLAGTTIDDHGFEQEIGFESLPPQDVYRVHIWVFFSSKGMGRIWGPLATHRIISLKRSLCEAFDVSYDRVFANSR